MTVQDFLDNPDIHFYDFHELHNGAIVEVPPPGNDHVDIQLRLETLFRAQISKEYTVLREFYFTLPAESRRADVAVVRESRRREQRKKTFFGSPEILVEVLSDSNKAADLSHLRRLCLTGNTEHFWVVDPFEQVVEVNGRDGTWHEYRQDGIIRFHFDGRDLQISVAGIFED